MKTRPKGAPASPAKALAAAVAKFDPAVARVVRAARSVLRRRFRTAVELVYDNYNALAIGFGPSGKAGQAILSLAVMPRWVTLCFLRGVGLPDPHGLLNGAGNQVRHVQLKTAEAFDDPRLQALIDAALDRAEPPIDPGGEQRLVIKSVSAKQRPRRPGGG
jgi:hypothetical protein